jgi:hypothetical protein
MRPDKNAELTLADDERLAESLAYALRHYNGKKRARDADELIARLAADRLVKHLHTCGYVVMVGPPTVAHSTP